MASQEQTKLHSASAKGRALQLLRGMFEDDSIRQGSRLPAESTLARDFNVSRVTLRSALGVLEQEGLVRRERNVGCIRVKVDRPELSLMERTIVLLSDLQVANSPEVYGGTSESVMSGVMDAVNNHGLNVLRVGSMDDTDQWLQNVIRARPRGAIVCWWRAPGPWQWSALEKLAASGMPVVTYGHDESYDRFDSVRSDHAGGTYQLVNALASQGKRRILRMWTLPDAIWVRQHDLGYERAIAKLGIPSLPAVHIEDWDRGDDLLEAVYRRRTRLMAGYLTEHMHGPNAIDAIMTANDREAMAALAACRLYGRTDIPVVGYDNSWQSMPERQWETGIPFATVDKQNHELGKAMADLLWQRINGTLPAGPQTRWVEQKIVFTM